MLNDVLRYKLSDVGWWRERCLHDLFFLCRLVLSTLDDPTPGYKHLYPPTHKRLCDFITKYALPGNILLILLPRGWVKSYLITVGWMIQRLLQNLVLGRQEQYIINNATLPNSLEFLSKIQYNLEYNDLLRKVFSDVIPANPATEARRWTQSEIDLGGTKIETGSAEGNLVSRHYSGGLINDDLVNRENSATSDQIFKVKDFWRLGQSLKMPKSIEFIPGTRWAYDDLYGDLMERFLFVGLDDKAKEAVFKKYQTEPYFEWHTGKWHLFHASCWADPVNEKGSTFPTLFSEKKIHEIKEEQGERFGGQYLNDPLALSSTKFKLNWLKTWNTLPPQRATYLLLDFAGTENKDNDESGMVVWDAGVDKRLYCRYAARKRYSDHQTIEWLIETALAFQPGLIGIESHKFGLVRDLLPFILGQMVRMGKVPKPLLEYAQRIPYRLTELKHHSRPKELRIGNMSGWWEKGLMLLAPNGMADFRDELMRFMPGKEQRRDNIIDAAAYILDVMVFPSVTDLPKVLVVPDHLKKTDEEREREFWTKMPEVVRSGQLLLSDDVEHLF